MFGDCVSEGGQNNKIPGAVGWVRLIRGDSHALHRLQGYGAGASLVGVRKIGPPELLGHRAWTVYFRRCVYSFYFSLMRKEMGYGMRSKRASVGERRGIHSMVKESRFLFFLISSGTCPESLHLHCGMFRRSC